MKAIPGIEFIIFDKSAGWQAYRKLRKQLRHRSFDILFHLQLALRASLASLCIPAKIKLGFDRERAHKDRQAWFSNEKIEPLSRRQHVVDSFLEFPRHFGLEPVLRWDLPVNPQALIRLQQQLAQKQVKPQQPVLVINPCALAKAKNWRNWYNEGYAAIADYAASQRQMQVVLSGGSTKLEQQTAAAIMQQCRHPPLNLVGKTRLDELVALLKRADTVIAPDTGPVHIASALSTKTIGLYASTNPQRAGPYNFPELVVNKYPEALQRFNHQSPETAPWGMRVKTAEAMRLIQLEDVIEKLNLP